MRHTAILLYILGCLTLASGSALIGSMMDNAFDSQSDGFVGVTGSQG